jgi:hypothetical protein
MFGRRTVTYDNVEYAPEAQFRVVAEGARLSGWVTAGRGASQGWGQKLEVGDIITCTGLGAGMGGDPGYGVEFTSDAAKEARAFHVDFRPQVGGIWNSRPAPGYLEPVAE